MVRLSISVAASIVSATATLLAQAAPVTIYDSLGPSVPNLSSLGYQATSTSEFGDRIGFAAGPRNLQSVTVRMSSWALQSTYAGNASYSNAAGYDQALTFNIYGAGSGASHGGLLGSETITSLVPWRPAASAGCGSAYLASDGNCYNGLAFDVTFDFSALGLTLPEQIVFGLAFNTQSYGPTPTGVDGPYNSLNFGLSAGTTVGTDVDAQSVFWDTASQGFLVTGTANTFGEDRDTSANGWGGFVPAVSFVVTDATTVPEPASLALVGIALFGAAFARRKR